LMAPRHCHWSEPNAENLLKDTSRPLTGHLASRRTARRAVRTATTPRCRWRRAPRLKLPQDCAPAGVKGKSGTTSKGTLHRPKKWLLRGETTKHKIVASTALPSRCHRVPDARASAQRFRPGQPEIVAHGRKPDVFVCVAFVIGRMDLASPENANLMASAQPILCSKWPTSKVVPERARCVTRAIRQNADPGDPLMSYFRL
jgi:hypothetical protein